MSLTTRGARRVLLLGGGAGTGKSTIAAALAERLGAARLELDDVWTTALGSAAVGSAERDALDIDGALRGRASGRAELLARHVTADEAVCARLGAAIDQALVGLDPQRALVVDGAWLLPSVVAGLAKRLAPLDAEVRAVVVHEPDDVLLARAMTSRRGDAPVEAWHADSARLAADHGAWLVAQARACGVPVVESRPWSTAADRVLAAASSSCQTHDRL